MKLRPATDSASDQGGFLVLWFGQLVSSLGDKLLHMNAIALAMAAGQAAGLAMARILIWTTLPVMALGLAAGMVVDRASRKGVMITSDAVRAVLVGLLPLAAASGAWLATWVLAAVAAASAFFGPARTALIPTVVSRDRLVQANAAFTVSQFVVALAGTLLGTVLISVAGVAASLWVNAALFAFSGIVIAAMRLPAPEARPEAPATWIGTLLEIAKGARLVKRHRAVQALVLHSALLMGVASLLYIGVAASAGASAEGIQAVGRQLTAVVLGLVTGGLVANPLSRGLALRRVSAVGLSAIAVGAAALLLAGPGSAALLGLAVIGVGGAIDAAAIEAGLQRVIPEALRGRVLSIRGIATSAGVLVASVLAAAVIPTGGTGPLHGAVALTTGALAVGLGLRGRGVGYAIVRWVLRQLTYAYLRLDVRGLEQLPTSGGLIVAGNHPNVMDGVLLLVSSTRPVRFLVAEEMYTHRFLHWLFKLMGCIPVYRRGANNGDALRGAIAALRRGEVIGIYPEGTTNYGGSMTQVKRGVALLALRTGSPVVPFGIRGSAEAYPKGQRAPTPGSAIRMQFGRPASYGRMLADRIPEEHVERTLEDIRQRILNQVHALGQGPVASWELKDLQVAAASLIIVPLTSFLTSTANPSLEPPLASAGGRTSGGMR